MEIQLQELIEQIKKDGVEVAENEASSIVEKAKVEAERIISNANAEAKRLISDAKEENERFVKVSEDAIRQAGRNLLISFRDSVNRELNAIVNHEVSSLYSTDELSKLISNVVLEWSKNTEIDDIEVLVNSKDADSIKMALLKTLKDKMENGVTVKPNDNFDGGFRIAISGGKAYYDYSKDAVTEMLSAYLNPRVTALMKEAE